MSSLLLLAFVLFLLGGAAAMSRLAGWHVLSRLYSAPVSLPGEQFTFSSATLGNSVFPVTYRRCVRLALSPQGLGLSLMFPFRFHSPAFLVPWSCIVACTEEQALATRKVTFSFKSTDRQLTLSGPLGQHAKAAFLEATATAA